MLTKIHRLRGMDLRSSDINRPPEYASDVINMEPDSNGEWTNRRGFEKKFNFPNTVDVFDRKRGGESVILTPTSLRKFDGATVTNINLGGSLPLSGWSTKASWAEYNGVLYWTDPTGNTDLFKYDGYMSYRAGIPKVTVNSISGGAGTFYRVAFYFVDMQGQYHWGDYTQIEAAVASFINIDTTRGTEFYNKHSKVDGNQNVDAANLDVTVFSHNFVAGDYIRAESNAGKFIPLEITAVTATEITFEASDVGTDTFSFLNANQIEQIFFTKVWASPSETYGFTFLMNTPLDNTVTSINLPNFPAFVATNEPMEDIYDTIKLKGLPPRFKYITIHNNVMVGSNQSVLNNVSTIDNVTPRDEDTFYWSDLGLASTVETFAPDDKSTLGKTDEGPLSGIFSNSDSLIIFKEKQVYYINGILTGRLFRIRTASTNKIGCVSHRSIQEFDGGCVFMSSRGLYFARNGASPVEISDIVENYFTNDSLGLDFSSSISALSEKDEKFYVYTPSTVSEDNDSVICYDYKYQDWFKYDSIPARGGFHMIGDDIFYAKSNGDMLQRFDDRNDDAVKITSAWSSAWWNMGDPSVKKKYTNFALMSTKGFAWSASVKVQCNWVDNDETSSTLSMSASTPVQTMPLPMLKAYATRFIIEHSTINKTSLISGYEFEFEAAQSSPKGGN